MLALIALALVGCASAQPTMPQQYYVQLTWQQTSSTGVLNHFKHDRYYDISGQLYRDDTFGTDGSAIVETKIQKPTSDKLSYDMNFATGVCLEQPDQSRIDGYIPTWPDMQQADDTVNGVKAKKYTKQFQQYNVSVWYASGDSKVADGTPLQVYNSNQAAQKAVDKGITTIAKYESKVDKTEFDLPDVCKTHPVTPAPTPVVPTPSPADRPHWIRDWSTSKCACMKVDYVGVYKTQDICEQTECGKKPPAPTPAPEPKPTPAPKPKPTPAPKPKPTPAPAPKPTPAPGPSGQKYKCEQKGSKFGCVQADDGTYDSHDACSAKCGKPAVSFY